MRKITALVLAVGLLSIALPAQGVLTGTLPRGFDNTDGGYSPPQGVPFNTANNSKAQWIYAWEQFPTGYPVTITEIAFRRSADNMVAGGTFTNVTVTMSSSATSHNQASATYANNYDTDVAVVYAGPLTIPAVAAPVTPAVPAPWLVTIPLQLPFVFDPNRHKDFLLEISVDGGPGVAAGFPIDGTYPTSFASQNYHTTDPFATAGNWRNPDACGIVRLSYIPGVLLPGTGIFDLAVATSGGGLGDLQYSLVNVPPTAVEGYTLISTTPTAAVGLGFGDGPVLGLWPDALTFAIINSPAQSGDFFHYPIPSAPGTFPTQPLVLPPGSASFFAGQVWELAAVVLAPGGSILGVSAPKTLMW